LRRAEDILRAELNRVIPGWSTTNEGRSDQRWYWAAPALLDARLAPWIRTWLSNPRGWGSLAPDPDEDYSTGLSKHINLFAEVFNGKVELGHPPSDLITVLAEISLAAPGCCALRALGRIAPFVDLDESELLNAAARIADAFRTLFNLPDTMGLLRAGEEEASYWRRVLRHGIEGNLQAVLDEYVHGLSEQLGLSEHSSTKAIAGVAAAIVEALSLRTSRLEFDEIRVGRNDSSIQMDRRFRLRSRFAMRFGDVEDDASGKLARADIVRSAFNSPFRPFVLATTSIGQEGLDFHPYCHSVYHWNLPPNPVDMEQREGRVHRYKGHAVRKNVARQLGLDSLRKHWTGSGDPWQVLFELAKEGRDANVTDLVPYWIYEIEGGAKVERRVPIIPFSREQERLRALKRSLAVYRLVFGQPRQEELLAYLESRLDGAGQEVSFPDWRISLAPPPSAPPRSELPPPVPTTGKTAKPKTLFCIHCGKDVVHLCPAETGAPASLYVSGDELMLFCEPVGNAEGEYKKVTVEDAGEGWVRVSDDSGVTVLRYLRDRLWADEGSNRKCEIVSRRTLAGVERQLFCRTCLNGQAHSCSQVKLSELSLSPGERVFVSYPPAPGIDDGELEAFVISVRGQVAKLYFRYKDDTEDSLFVARSPDGRFRDLDYDLPCSLSLTSAPFALQGN
jgi:hypothetical protein